MLYYDDRDYYNADNIDELYDSEEVYTNQEDDTYSEWLYDYHKLADEITED